MKNTRLRNTLMGKVLAAQEKRSLLPTGKAIRAVMWQRLTPMAPDQIDHLELWQVGALLGHHMVEKDATEREEADRIIKQRADKIIAVQEAETQRQTRGR